MINVIGLFYYKAQGKEVGNSKAGWKTQASSQHAKASNGRQ
jgi:hypothetical protein